MYKEVAPVFFALSLPALLSHRRRMTSMCPFWDAMNKEAAPSCVALSLSAPFPHRERTASMCPLWVAMSKEVAPSHDLHVPIPGRHV